MTYHDNPFNPDSKVVFVIYVTVLCEPSCNSDYAVSYTYGFIIHGIFSYIVFPFCPNLFSNDDNLRYHIIDVTKRFREKTEGFQNYFMVYHMQCSCMYKERYYQMSFVIPSTPFLKLLPLLKKTKMH